MSIIFGNEYKIIGLPFFNEEQRLIEFEEAMESLLRRYNVKYKGSKMRLSHKTLEKLREIIMGIIQIVILDKTGRVFINWNFVIPMGKLSIKRGYTDEKLSK